MKLLLKKKLSVVWEPRQTRKGGGEEKDKERAGKDLGRLGLAWLWVWVSID
jgi:hypothetical protein